jgi:LysR family transcriptional regulator, cys regulon transcriptional activator
MNFGASKKSSADFRPQRPAKALSTSQPGVSRQIQMLERDLGVSLLVRKKNRVVAFSPVGRTILAVAKSLLNQAANIELLADEAQALPRSRADRCG